MLYNKHNLAVAKIAATSNLRKELTCVAFFKDKTVATDAFRLIEVSTPKGGHTIDDYPTIEGINIVKNIEKEPILLRAKTVQALKPVKATKSLPILNHIVLSSRGDDRFELVSTNLEDLKTETINAVVDKDFPKYEQVIPKGEPKAIVRVNGKYLSEIVTLLGNLSALNHTVDIEIHGENQPIVIKAEGNGQTGRGLVMPIKRYS